LDKRQDQDRDRSSVSCPKLRVEKEHSQRLESDGHFHAALSSQRLHAQPAVDTFGIKIPEKYWCAVVTKCKIHGGVTDQMHSRAQADHPLQR